MERVDNSRLVAAATCSTKCAMHYCFEYVGKEEPAPRRCGADIHKALAEYFRTGSADRAMGVLTQEYAPFAQGIGVDDRLAWVNVAVIVEEWLRAHPVEALPYSVAGRPEQGISFNLTSEVEFWALVDLPVRERSTGALYVADHKTTGKITDWWARQFRLGSQITGYCVALAASMGEVVSGAYVNCIELGKLPVGPEKCRVHKVSKDECMRAHARWQLLTTTRSQKALDEWRGDAIALAGKFRGIQKLCAAGLGVIPYLPQEGKWNNGCVFCDLRDFCIAGRQPQLVEQMLVKGLWRPWERKEAEV